MKPQASRNPRTFRCQRIWQTVIACTVLWMGSATASATAESEITAIVDTGDVSIIESSAGLADGVRMGMKMLATRDDTPFAELIVVQAQADQSRMLITEIFGPQALTVGDRVALKTIHFATSWKSKL